MKTTHLAHAERHEPMTTTAASETSLGAYTPSKPERSEPCLPVMQCCVTPQSIADAQHHRVSAKWMTNEAVEAFAIAQRYIDDMTSGEKPAPLVDYAPARSDSFYTAMAIGVRTYLQVDAMASGVE